MIDIAEIMKYLIALLCFAVPLAQAIEPFSIKGVFIGMEKELVTQKFVAEKTCIVDAFYIFSSVVKNKSKIDTLAGVDVKSITAHFTNKKLVQLTYSLPVNGGKTVSEALREKFGTPTLSKNTVGTPNGEVKDQITQTWNRGDDELTMTISLGKFRLEDYQVSLTSITDRNKRLEQKKSHAKKDL